jgi:hypothetical protein
MTFDRPHRDEHLGGDLPVGQPAADCGQYLGLPRRDPGYRQASVSSGLHGHILANRTEEGSVLRTDALADGRRDAGADGSRAEEGHAGGGCSGWERGVSDAHATAWGRSFAVAAGLLILAGGLTGVASTASAAPCQNWTGVPPPSPGAAGNVLNGVAMVSACDAWAVGFFSGNPARAIALHWNGSKWTNVTVPDPTNPEASTLLTGVTATSASNALAVGMTETTTIEQGLILRWAGTGWMQVLAPSPSTSAALSAVAATSASNAWAVGTFSTTVAGQALAIHCC